MALVTINELLVLSMKGQLGDMVFYPHPFKRGLYIVRGKGARSKGTTDPERHTQSNFKRANEFAKLAQHDPAYLAAHEATHRSPFNLAMANFLNVPVVEDIELTGYTGKAGESIRIQAVDDFEVVGVEVRILDAAGAVVEAGYAVRNAKIKTAWTYVATATVAAGQAVVIEVTAVDGPGNRTVKTVDRLCRGR